VKSSDQGTILVIKLLDSSRKRINWRYGSDYPSCQAYHTTLLPHHNARPDLITDKLRYRFASIAAMFSVQRTIRATTSPQSMNVAGKNPMLPRTSAIEKKGNGTQRKTKVSP